MIKKYILKLYIKLFGKGEKYIPICQRENENVLDNFLNGK
tara:strand:+ start:727 stop:846 length:120 start_codon:yes stop_codon:yes gene_type:complete